MQITLPGADRRSQGKEWRRRRGGNDSGTRTPRVVVKTLDVSRRHEDSGVGEKKNFDNSLVRRIWW